MSAGDLAYYPSNQSHGLVTISDPQAVYVALRFLSSSGPSSRATCHFWSHLDRYKTEPPPSNILDAVVTFHGSASKELVFRDDADRFIVILAGGVLLTRDTVAPVELHAFETAFLPSSAHDSTTMSLNDDKARAFVVSFDQTSRGTKNAINAKRSISKAEMEVHLCVVAGSSSKSTETVVNAELELTAKIGAGD